MLSCKKAGRSFLCRELKTAAQLMSSPKNYMRHRPHKKRSHPLPLKCNHRKGPSALLQKGTKDYRYRPRYTSYHISCFSLTGAFPTSGARSEPKRAALWGSWASKI